MPGSWQRLYTNRRTEQGESGFAVCQRGFRGGFDISKPQLLKYRIATNYSYACCLMYSRRSRIAVCGAMSAGALLLARPAVAQIQQAGTLYVDLRASDPIAGSSIWTNRGTLGNFARVGGPSQVLNVGGTGFAGVLFGGVTNDAYLGPNSVSDIDGGSDRSRRPDAVGGLAACPFDDNYEIVSMTNLFYWHASAIVSRWRSTATCWSRMRRASSA